MTRLGRKLNVSINSDHQQQQWPNKSTIFSIVLCGCCITLCYLSLGSLCITGHHLILSTRKKDENELWLLHQCIDLIERLQPKTDYLTKDWINNTNTTYTGGTIVIYCKDLRILKLEVTGWQEYLNVAESLDRLSKLHPSQTYAFFYRPMYNILEDGHTLFKPEIEHAKLLAGGAWRLTKVNSDFTVSPMYAKSLIVPSVINDDDIVESANFREEGRFPIMCYKHRDAVLLRAAPILQLNGVKRCTADETIVNLVLGRTTKGFIIETKAGKTTLTPDMYPQWKKVSHIIRVTPESFAKLVEACNDTSSSVDKYLERLENSVWLSLVLKTLNTACIAAQCMDIECTPVLLQGIDTALIVSGLVQIILNPDCRTVRGFIALIDREFIQGGYPFSTRHQHFCYSPLKSKLNAPGFLLFLDCVYQLHFQFSCSFEFKTFLLEILFENSYFSQYGTFVGDCDKEREQMGTYTKTTSLWTHLFRPEVMKTVLSPIYEPNPNVIWPSVAPCSIVLWSELYLRWSIDQRYSKELHETIHSHIRRQKDLRLKAIKLRKELTDLQKEYNDLQNQQTTGTSSITS